MEAFILMVVVSAGLALWARVEAAERREQEAVKVLARENQYMTWLRTHNHSPQCDCELNRRAIR